MKTQWIIRQNSVRYPYLTLTEKGKYMWGQKVEAVPFSLKEGQKIRDSLADETTIERV